MKTLLTLFAALTLGLGAASVATADTGHRYAAHGPDRAAGTKHDRFPDRMARRLDLSPEQRERIRGIMAEGAPEMRDKAKALREAQRDLRTFGFSHDYDPARAGEMAQRQAELSAGLALSRAERMSAVYAVLTPEQREKLADWRPKKRKHARGRSHD